MKAAGAYRDWPTWLALAALTVSAWLANTRLFRQEIQGNTDQTRHIAGVLGGWSQIDESEPSAGEIRGLETRDIIKRTYANSQGQYVELVVAYIEHSSRKSAHAQEACLRGSGALVGLVESRQLERTPVLAKTISMEFQNQRQHVYYWYKIGNEYTADYLISSLKMFLGGLVGSKSQGASLIRLLTPVGHGESQMRIDARLEDFAMYLLPELEKNLP